MTAKQPFYRHVARDKIRGGVDVITKVLDAQTSEYEREPLDDRIPKLPFGVAQMKGGAATETESKKRKLRVKEPLRPTRAAVEVDIIPCGRPARLRIRDVPTPFRAASQEHAPPGRTR